MVRDSSVRLFLTCLAENHGENQSFRGILLRYMCLIEFVNELRMVLFVHEDNLVRGWTFGRFSGTGHIQLSSFRNREYSQNKWMKTVRKYRHVEAVPESS
jgi:hypothetical protein